MRLQPAGVRTAPKSFTLAMASPRIAGLSSQWPRCCDHRAAISSAVPGAMRRHGWPASIAAGNLRHLRCRPPQAAAGGAEPAPAPAPPPAPPDPAIRSRLAALGAVLVGAAALAAGLGRQSDVAPAASYAPYMTARAAAAREPSLADWVTERSIGGIQALNGASFVTKVVVMMVACLPAVAVVGAAYSHFSGVSLGSAIYKVYLILYRAPGTNIVKEPNLASYLITNTVFIVGVFTFATILALIADDVKLQLRSLRSGNYPVSASGHIVVLNWNRNAVPLLRHIAMAQAHLPPFAPRPAVVVVADKAKADMDAAVSDGLRAQRLEVHTRRGEPYRIKDLSATGVKNASAVIVLQPEAKSGEALEALMAATAVNVSVMAPSATVVVQAPSAGVAVALRSLERVRGDSKLSRVQITESALVNRLVTQSASQPGLIHAWAALMDVGSRDGANLGVTPLPARLEGCRYRDVRAAARGAVVVGTISADGSAVRLNPSDDEALRPGDRAVVLANARTDLGGVFPEAAPKVPPALATIVAAPRTAAAKAAAAEQSRPRQVMVLGWEPAQLGSLIDGFADFSPAGTTVVFVMRALPAGMPAKKGACSFKYALEAAPFRAATLARHGIATADTVIIGSSAALSGNEADAAVMAALVQVQDAALRSGRASAPHVIAGINRPHIAKLVFRYLEAQRAAARPDAAAAVIAMPELLLPQDMAAAILHQVAAQPAFSPIVATLLDTADGAELYLRSPLLLGLAPGREHTFGEMAARARAAGQTALGYLKADGSCVLAPPAEATHIFEAGERVVVLADDWAVV